MSTLILDYTPSGGPLSAPGNGWTPDTAGVWSVTSGNLLQATTLATSNSYITESLARPGSEACQDQRMVLKIPPGQSANAAFIACLRRVDSQDFYFADMDLAQGFSILKMQSGPSAAFAGALSGFAALSTAYNSAHWYYLVFDAIGVSPTALTATWYDAGSGASAVALASATQLQQVTASDSTTALQTAAGTFAVDANFEGGSNGSITFAEVLTYNMASVVTATTYTLTGPTTGTTGATQTYTAALPSGQQVASSTVVTVTADGTSIGTVTFPANTSGASGTVTYTPSTAATHTIAATNNGGLTNPASITDVVGAAGGGVTFTADDARFQFDPYVWTFGGGVGSGTAMTPYDNAGVEFIFEGATLAVNVGASTFSPYTQIEVEVDRGASQVFTLSGAPQALSVIVPNDEPVHTCRVQVKAISYTSGADSWGPGTPNTSLTITGVTLAASSNLRTRPAPALTILLLGDSNAAGDNSIAAQGTWPPTIASSDARLSYAAALRRELGAAVGVVGVGGQGYVAVGARNTPNVAAACASVLSGAPRTLSGASRAMPTPDVIVIAHGANDVYQTQPTATVTTNVQTVISTLDALLPKSRTTPFAVFSPLPVQATNTYWAAVQAGVTAAKNAGYNAIYIDASNYYTANAALTLGATGYTADSPDGGHIYGALASTQVARKMAAQIRPILTPALGAATIAAAVRAALVDDSANPGVKIPLGAVGSVLADPSADMSNAQYVAASGALSDAGVTTALTTKITTALPNAAPAAVGGFPLISTVTYAGGGVGPALAGVQLASSEHLAIQGDVGTGVTNMPASQLTNVATAIATRTVSGAITKGKLDAVELAERSGHCRIQYNTPDATHITYDYFDPADTGLTASVVTIVTTLDAALPAGKPTQIIRTIH